MELEQVFYRFPKYQMKLLLGDFNAKMWKEDIFKPTIGNESLYQDGNDNDVRIVKLATSKQSVVTNTLFPNLNIHKYIWTSPDAKTHNQNEHILMTDKRWHSSIPDVRSFRRVECDTNHYLEVAKVRKRLRVSK